MKIAITGGTGQVGTLLARAFHKDGHEVIVFGRQSGRHAAKTARWRVERWSLDDVSGWANKLVPPQPKVIMITEMAIELRRFNVIIRSRIPGEVRKLSQ